MSIWPKKKFGKTLVLSGAFDTILAAISYLWPKFTILFAFLDNNNHQIIIFFITRTRRRRNNIHNARGRATGVVLTIKTKHFNKNIFVRKCLQKEYCRDLTISFDCFLRIFLLIWWCLLCEFFLVLNSRPLILVNIMKIK